MNLPPRRSDGDGSETQIWIMPYAQAVAALLLLHKDRRRSAGRGDVSIATTLPDAQGQNLNDPIVNKLTSSLMPPRSTRPTIKWFSVCDLLVSQL